MSLSRDGTCALIVGAVGVASIVCGTFLSPPTGTAVVAAAVGGALGNAGSGLLGNIAHDGIREGLALVSERLRDASRPERLPVNHDLARALRKAHLHAIQYLAEEMKSVVKGQQTGFEQEFGPDAVANVNQFYSSIRKWLKLELHRADRTDFMIAAPLNEVLSLVGKLAAEGNAAEKLQHEGTRAAFDEAASGARAFGSEPPEAFRRLFEGGANGPGWLGAAQAFFAESIKSDERVRTVVFLDHLARTSRSVEAANRLFVDRVLFLQRGLDERFAKLEAAIRELSDRRVDVQVDAIRRDILEALTREDFVDAIQRQIGIEAPSDHWAASRASIDVQKRIQELTGRFFGRSNELARLDAFVNSNSSGVILVTAPAGSGKSSVLANWITQRRSQGDYVPRHFASLRFQATSDPVDAMRHLLAQLREIDLQNPNDAALRIPVTEYELLDQLTARLTRPMPDGQKLILILDGVDELRRPLADIFVRSHLGAGNYVVVSGRASANEKPPYLAPWFALEEARLPFEHLALTGLSTDAIGYWLRDLLSGLREKEISGLAAKLRSTTDGLPLFLSYVISDLALRLPQFATETERFDHLSTLPAPFSSYVKAEFESLKRELGAEWSASTRQLFSLLTRLRGPILELEVEEIFRQATRRDPTSPVCPVLTALDHRVSRWLSLQSKGSSFTLSFAHPRLAQAFAEALGPQSVEAEAHLIRWMETAWRDQAASGGGGGDASYAVDWLADHLRSTNPPAAHQLLGSVGYLKARLSLRGGDQRQRLGAFIDDWANLRDDLKRKNSWSIVWDKFWRDNADRLMAGLESALPQEQAKIVLESLGDAGVSGADNLTLRTRATLARPIYEEAPLQIDAASGHVDITVIENQTIAWNSSGYISIWDADRTLRCRFLAHDGPAKGVIAIGDGFVSWGRDGAIKFWHTDGGRKSGGHSDAHPGGVAGIIVHNDLLVSWGSDGVVRFWSQEGDSLSSTANVSHARGVGGVLSRNGRLVSWGYEGSVCFWSCEGPQSIRATSTARLMAGLRGLVAHELLIGWGTEEGIGLWDWFGRRIADAECSSYSNSITGALALADRFISWGADGSICFWSFDGKRLLGGGEVVHRAPVLSVVALPDRLVSFDAEGELCFWNHRGAQVAGGKEPADSNWENRSSIGDDEFPTTETAFDEDLDELTDGVAVVTRFGNTLASFGHDRALRFWTLAGESIPGGCPGDDIVPIWGLLALERELLTWDIDGNMSFWDEQGMRVRQVQSLFGEGLRDVVLRDGFLISSDWIGSICVYDKEGRRLTPLLTHLHSSAVIEVKPFQDGFVSLDADGRLSIWNLAGVHIGGIDDDDLNIRDYVVFGEKLVTGEWGGDIRFWSFAGKSIGEKEIDAVSDGFRGLRVFDDCMVSWGRDGLLRYWGEDGREISGETFLVNDTPVPRAGTIDELREAVDELTAAQRFAIEMRRNRHPADDPFWETIDGIHSIGDRVITWGENFPIRIWTAEGILLHEEPSHSRIEQLNGVLVIDSHFVTWSRDGAIRFWDRDGQRITGGDDNAHSTGNPPPYLPPEPYDPSIQDFAPRESSASLVEVVPGLIIVDHLLISWGKGSGIRVWDQQGRLVRRPVPSRPERVAKLVVAGENLIALGERGGLQQWSRSGTPIETEERDWFREHVRGLVDLGDAVMTWTWDGSIRLWGPRGEALSGGDPSAHKGGVNGLLRVEDRVVSWGEEGSILFWGLGGRPLQGGSLQAHEGQVITIVRSREGLISVGSDNQIHRWSLVGEHISSTKTAAVPGIKGIVPLNECFVVWNRYGGISFWNYHLQQIEGGDPKAHWGGGVTGMMLAAGRLISWGQDGALRFWTTEGKRTRGGDAWAHEGAVYEVRQVGDRLVSRGADGAIRFWDLEGKNIQAVAETRDDGGVAGLLASGNSMMSWSDNGSVTIWNAKDRFRPSHRRLDEHSDMLRRVMLNEKAFSIGEFGEFLTWSNQGVVRLWSRAADLLETIVVPGGIRSLYVVDSKIYAFGQSLWVYPLSGAAERLL